MPLGAVADLAPVDPRYYGTVLVTYGMLFALTSTLLLGFSELLRRGEEQLRKANEQLERLGDFRRDFLHIALHNVQAPVGAVTMLLQNMRHGLGGPLTELQTGVAGPVPGETPGAQQLRRDLRLLGALEGDPLAAGTEELDLLGLLEEVAAAYRDTAADAGHEMLPGAAPQAPTGAGRGTPHPGGGGELRDQRHQVHAPGWAHRAAGRARAPQRPHRGPGQRDRHQRGGPAEALPGVREAPAHQQRRAEDSRGRAGPLHRAQGGGGPWRKGGRGKRAGRGKPLLHAAPDPGSAGTRSSAPRAEPGPEASPTQGGASGGG
jgi:hypothetical protein